MLRNLFVVTLWKGSPYLCYVLMGDTSEENKNGDGGILIDRKDEKGDK